MENALTPQPAGGAPIGASLPAGTPAWGAGWKKAMKDWYGHSMKVSISTTCMSYRGNYLDLDPTYKDPYGQPLLRITFDWKENELKLQRFLRERAVGDTITYTLSVHNPYPRPLNNVVISDPVAAHLEVMLG